MDQGDLSTFHRVIGDWFWTTIPATANGTLQPSGYVVFHEDGYCTLHYPAIDDWGSSLGYPNMHEDLVTGSHEFQ
jgi:hypothetical protein